MRRPIKCDKRNLLEGRLDELSYSTVVLFFKKLISNIFQARYYIQILTYKIIAVIVVKRYQFLRWISPKEMIEMIATQLIEVRVNNSIFCFLFLWIAHSGLKIKSKPRFLKACFMSFSHEKDMVRFCCLMKTSYKCSLKDPLNCFSF